jgi:HEAT repeat protein
VSEAVEITCAKSPVVAKPSGRRRPRWLLIFGLILLGSGVAFRVWFDNWPTFTLWLESQRLTAQLRSENPIVADRAAKKLMDLGPAGETILLGAVHDRIETTRCLACRYISQLPIGSTTIVSTLAEALGDKEPAVRLEAARGFGPRYQLATWANGDESLREIVLSSLTSLLSDDQPLIQMEAANGLAAFGPNASSAVETLGSLLRDKDRNLRAAAGCALLQIDGPNHPEAGNAIVESLTQPDPGTLALEPISLAAALHIAEPELRARALTALVAQLRSDKPEVRSFALSVFKEMRGDARSAVPSLESLVKELGSLAGKSMLERAGGTEPGPIEDVNLTIRCDVASVLVAIDGKSSFVGISALLDAVADPAVGRDRRWQAYKILERTDPNTLGLTVPVLLEMIDDPDPLIRNDARELVKRIDPRALFDALKKSSRP